MARSYAYKLELLFPLAAGAIELIIAGPSVGQGYHGKAKLYCLAPS